MYAMSRIITKAVVCILLMGAATISVSAQQDSSAKANRLTIGGYGEAVYKYNFYSDNVFRYSHADRYADSRGHGRVDLPHAVLMLGMILATDGAWALK